LRLALSGRDDLVDDEVDVALRVVLVLGRDDVGGDEGGLFGVPVDDVQGPDLIGHGQPVSGFDLEGRRALASSLLEQVDEVAFEFVLGGRAGGGHGGGDASGRVLLPGHAGGEFLGPVAGEDEVVVAVNESRDDGFAAQVDGLELGQLPYRGDLTVDDVIVVDRRDLGARGRRRAAAETARSLFAGTEMLRDCGVRLGGRSRPDDTAVVDEQGGIGDDVQFAERIEVVDDQLADPGEKLHDGSAPSDRECFSPSMDRTPTAQNRPQRYSSDISDTCGCGPFAVPQGPRSASTMPPAAQNVEYHASVGASDHVRCPRLREMPVAARDVGRGRALRSTGSLASSGFQHPSTDELSVDIGRRRRTMSSDSHLGAGAVATRSLAGRTIIMSGGSRGLGLAIALRAAHDGANVAIVAKTSEPHPNLEGTVYTAAEQIEAAGGKALPIIGDVRDDASVAEAVAD